MSKKFIKQALAIAAFAACMGAQAQEPAFAAKSLFFGEDGNVQAVATSKVESAPNAVASKEGKTMVVSTTEKKQVERKKVVAKNSTKAQPIGAAYFVRLKRNNAAPQDVLATHAFQTGDKFQVGLKVNRPSFVYIFNEAPDGQITMLHPRPGKSAAIDAMGTVFLPGNGSFQFDGPPGTEKLLVLMSPDEVFQPNTVLQKMKPDLVTRTVLPPPSQPSPAHANALAIRTSAPAQNNCSYTVADAGNFASKAIVFTEDPHIAATANDCQVNTTPAFASKAIVFADDPQPTAGQQVASYVVKPEGTKGQEPLLLKIQLAHH